MAKAVASSKAGKAQTQFYMKRATRRVKTALRLADYVLDENGRIAPDILTALDQPNLYMEMISVFSAKMGEVRRKEMESERAKRGALRGRRRRL